MKVFIEDNAKVDIVDILSKKDKEYSIMIEIASFGWGGPVLGLSLYEKKDGDEIINVDGINIFLDEGVADFPANIKIFKDTERFGQGLKAKYLEVIYDKEA